MKTQHTKDWILRYDKEESYAILYSGDYDYEVDENGHFKDLNGFRISGFIPERSAKLIESDPEMLQELISDIPLIEDAIAFIKAGELANAINHMNLIIMSHSDIIKKATE